MSEPQPVGPIVEPKPPGLKPDHRTLTGRWMQLEALSLSKHAASLYASFASHPAQAEIWTYLGYGPFADEAEFRAYVAEKEAARDLWFYAFVDRATGSSLGVGSFMRCDPPNGVIEIGHIWMAPSLQRTRNATETIFLMMRHAFEDLSMRRLEWKCDALNAPSRRAALRFGFTFEGIFRQHMIVKGRNRDTAWFAIIDKDWPRIRAGFLDWLRPENFLADGKQRSPLKVS